MDQLAILSDRKLIPAKPADQGGRIDAPDRRTSPDTAPVHQLAALCRRFGDQAVANGLRVPVLAGAT
jgi:hypothetical protein